MTANHSLWPFALLFPLFASCAAPSLEAEATLQSVPIAAVTNPVFGPLETDLAGMVERQELPSVVVAVQQEGKLAWAVSLGHSDREKGRPATLSTAYPIASMGKAIASIAALRAVESGYFTLDTRIDELPGPPVLDQQGFKAPSVRQLLQMTSGIPHAAMTARPTAQAQDQQHYDAITFIAYPPGTAFHYSNMSIHALDQTIEAATGQAYPQYVRENVFKPLDMANSWIGESPDAQVSASRYHADGQPVGKIGAFPRSSRQGHASASDLLKLANFLLDEGALSPLPSARVEQMFSDRSQIAGAHVALGVASLQLTDGTNWIASSGNDLGAQSHLSLFPERDLAVIVLSNGSGSQADEIALRAADLASPGLLPLAVAAMQDFQQSGVTIDKISEVHGRWRGKTAVSQHDLKIEVDVESSGAVDLRIDGLPQEVRVAAVRSGLLTISTLLAPGRIPGARSDVYLELNFTRHEDGLSGFAYVNFDTTHVKVERGYPIRLERAAN